MCQAWRGQVQLKESYKIMTSVNPKKDYVNIKQAI